jgi:hypothetical protein
VIDYAGYADKIAGQSFQEKDGFYKIVQYEPIGVCAGIAAWNATLMKANISSPQKSLANAEQIHWLENRSSPSCWKHGQDSCPDL